MSNVKPCHNFIYQITTLMVAQMESPGNRAAHRTARHLTPRHQGDRARTARTTRMTGATAPPLLLKPLKRNPPCTKEQKRHFKVLLEQTVDLQEATSPAVLEVRGRTTSTARVTDKERKVLTRAKEARVDTCTAPPTQAR